MQHIVSIVLKCLHNHLTDLDFERCDKGNIGRQLDTGSVFASVCKCMRVHSRRQTEGCDVLMARCVQVHCLKPLSYPPSLSLHSQTTWWTRPRCKKVKSRPLSWRRRWNTHKCVHIENYKGTPTTIACHTWHVTCPLKSIQQLQLYMHNRKWYIFFFILCDHLTWDDKWEKKRNRGWLEEWAYICLTATQETNTLKG